MTRAKELSKILSDGNLTGTLDVAGETTLQTHLNLGDNDKIKLGASGDLEIYHDTNHSYVEDTGTGELRLKTNGTAIRFQHGSETLSLYTEDGSVELFHNDSKKFETTSSGVTVTGSLLTTNIYGVGDTNTGIQFEGSDVLTFHSGGQENLQLTSNAIVFNQDSVDMDFRIESNNVQPMFFVDAGNDRVGIGTDSPTVTLQIEESSTGDAVKIARGGNYLLMGGSGSGTQYVKGYEGTVAFGNKYAGNTTFLTDDTERMRLDSSGNLGLNTGSSTGRATGKGMEILHVGSDTDATLRLTGENGSSAETFSEITHVGASRHMNFKHHGATRIQIDALGGVLVDGGSVGTVSDSRVKKDVEDLSDGLTIIKQLRPVKFKYKGNTEYYNGDDKIYQGFIADEVQAVAPQYITEVTNKIYDDEFDGTNIVDFDEELKDKKFTSVDDFKTMSQTDLIPMLVKAIQELEAKVTALENA